ncbi:MAG: glycosyltransferase family 4 protein [Candidatus Moraniibacteriota bacterium]|nr:MAG: glycosyltransferase family 4 protein [Candidatus Moranbacteria bacterium]
MRVGINASFARKPDTGIGQVTLNFLHKVSESSRVEFILYLEEELPNGINIPKHFQTRVTLPFWKRDDLVRKWWWERCLVPKQAKRDGCDVFISLYQSATVMPKSIRHIMLVHDIIPKLFPQYLNNWRKRYYWKSVEHGIRHADKLYAVSSHTEKDLIRHLGIAPSSVSVNRIDVDPIFKRAATSERSAEVMRKYRLSPGYLYFGGGLEWRKNAEGVLRAYRALLDREKSDHLAPPTPPLVVSGKLMPELSPLVTDVERLVKDLDLLPYVRILDSVPQRDLPALYVGAKLFLYPSLYEGFGLPVLEAMSVGTPVVTSKSSSLPEVGKDAVLYCRPDDVEDIASTVRNALSHREIREMLSKRGRERSALFSWNEFSRKLLRSAIGGVDT